MRPSKNSLLGENEAKTGGEISQQYASLSNYYSSKTALSE